MSRSRAKVRTAIPLDGTLGNWLSRRRRLALAAQGRRGPARAPEGRVRKGSTAESEQVDAAGGGAARTPPRSRDARCWHQRPDHVATPEAAQAGAAAVARPPPSTAADVHAQRQDSRQVQDEVTACVPLLRAAWTWRGGDRSRGRPCTPVAPTSPLPARGQGRRAFILPVLDNQPALFAGSTRPGLGPGPDVHPPVPGTSTEDDARSDRRPGHDAPPT